MDAKVLRAAVSAAIRVTVSTTLIGCGGTVTTEAGKAQGGSAANGPATSTEPIKSNTNPTHYPYPAGSSGSATTPNSGGHASGGQATSGGTGVAEGGVANLGGSAEGGSAEGGEGSAAPVVMVQSTCDALNTCLTHLEASMPSAPLSGGDAACCQVMVDGLKEHQVVGADTCWQDLNGRLMSSTARNLCCNSPETWQVSACTPWGPPVPPELPEEALSAWEAAA